MNDLAYTRPADVKEPAMPSPVGMNEGPRTEYPKLRFNGPQAEAAKLSKCAFGDEYEITVRIKATRIGGDEWEMRTMDNKPPADFDVISASEPKKVSSESEEQESPEEEEAEGPNDDEGKEEYVKPKRKIEMSPKDAGITKSSK